MWISAVSTILVQREHAFLKYTRAMGFYADRAKGEEIERLLAERLLAIGTHKQVLKALGTDSNWDLMGLGAMSRYVPPLVGETVSLDALVSSGSMLVSSVVTYEVKRDVMGDKTGNLAIEIKYKGQPSGISKTQADVWAHYIEGKFYLFDVPKFKDWLKVQWQWLRSVNAGDDAVAVLVPLDKVIGRDFYETI